MPSNGGLGDLTMAKEKSQVEKFREAAKDAGADDNEQHFDENLKKIAQQKHTDKDTKQDE